ncbi:5-oxoprolinase subunit PxpB [Aneurinibacillus terranovensis]|uniref:5-oxoprolinase subunit PxpB n=1 Tax=Aneurinibacillus terranovensis TaxID=278991 RepID=UPI000414E5C3|nr:5-oxoprolinase subunit PxpB [Aneurinibacillus terranovensis]
MEFFPLGDSAVVIQVGDSIDETVHHKVRILSAYLEDHPFPGMIEYVPAFTTVTVFYDPVRFCDSVCHSKPVGNQLHPSPYTRVCALLEQMLMNLDNKSNEQQRTVQIPVCYGGEFGPDLEDVAEMNGLTTDEVIAIHSGNEYLVYMIGFAPGFPYLGGMSERIAAARRSSPRMVIPAGSVGIAGMQTGVYPIETPGGWQVIGRTPVGLFKPDEHPPTLLRAGDRIRFHPVTREEYERWKGAEG